MLKRQPEHSRLLYLPHIASGTDSRLFSMLQWLGKGASFVLPTLLAFAIASGIFAAANYVRGPAPPEPAQPETKWAIRTVCVGAVLMRCSA